MEGLIFGILRYFTIKAKQQQISVYRRHVTRTPTICVGQRLLETFRFKDENDYECEI